jgi:hypothetical protein
MLQSKIFWVANATTTTNIKTKKKQMKRNKVSNEQPSPRRLIPFGRTIGKFGPVNRFSAASVKVGKVTS